MDAVIKSRTSKENRMDVLRANDDQYITVRQLRIEHNGAIEATHLYTRKQLGLVYLRYEEWQDEFFNENDCHVSTDAEIRRYVDGVYDEIDF